MTTNYRERVHYTLSHYKQRFNWDCGVSCTLMVLPPSKRNHFVNNFATVCREEGFNRSTWTIDLCYLLHRYGVRHEYFTITLGVHPGYYGHSFYDKIIKKDEDRINRRFSCARSVGLQVSCASISIQRIIEHLDTGGPIILLTNSRQLRCDTCKINKLSAELRQCLPWPPSYQGHYVVLCGYDAEFQRVFYRNPSMNDHVCSMSYSSLNEARQSYGTDEDIIFIYSDV
ncbi:uncharacterized protein CBL_01881 [Carabus blaptoides fortunei]